MPHVSDLRLKLLEVPCDPDLVRALYGLLMLLPQTEAFHTLRTRLSCIPSIHLGCDTRFEINICEKNCIFECMSSSSSIKPKKTAPTKGVPFQELLKHFIEVQDRHKEYKKITRNREITTGGRDMNDT